MLKSARRLVPLLLCFVLIALPAFGEGGDPAAPSQTALEGFYASAFNSEFADNHGNVLVRWEIPIRVYLQGSPTAEDLAELDSFLEDLRKNVPGLPDIAITAEREEANVYYSFVPYQEMADYLEEYETGNWGFMNCLSDKTGIRYGLIAVATDKTSRADRSHLIREEFVNMLGLTDDLDFAPESIIYQPYTVTPRLAPVDYEMLNLLYGPYVRVGMTRAEAEQALKKAYPGI